MTRDYTSRKLSTACLEMSLAAVILTTATPARAEQDPGTPDSGIPTTSEITPVKTESKSDYSYTIGAGALIRPEYLGSDEYEVTPVPLVNIQYGRFFARMGDGIGANIIETPGFTAAVAVYWMQGYGDDDVPTGIDKVDTALGGRVFMTANMKGIEAKLTVTQAITKSDRGLLVDAGVAYPVRVTDRLRIVPKIGTTWGNDKYMDGYFGINASESTASGLAAYEPSNGFRDVSARISARYRITDNVSAMGLVGVTRLVGDAADSPLVKEETQLVGVLGLTYTF